MMDMQIVKYDVTKEPFEGYIKNKIASAEAKLNKRGERCLSEAQEAIEVLQ